MRVLSVVIPAYNEESTLAAHFEALLPVLDGQTGWDWEIIVVDDGSLDGTAEIVNARACERIRLISYSPNRGKGAAVRTGVLAARGDAVLFCDADMATHPATLGIFMRALDEGAGIVIGNRRDPSSRIIRKQPPWRRILGRGFAWLSARLMSIPLEDFNCGFKLFRGEIARELFAQVTTQGWAFDIEVLMLAVRSGCRVVELPVEWRSGGKSSVRLPGDIFKTLREMACIRMRLSRRVAGSP